MGSKDGSHRHSGPRQCVQHLLKTEGLRGLTRGIGATIAREAPGNAIFFTVYEVSVVEVSTACFAYWESLAVRAFNHA